MLTALCLMAVVQSGVPAAQPPPAGPAVDPKTGVVHSQRLESGVPMGGIGCGGFQLMTDGGVSRVAINNNRQQPTGDLPGCFAALWIQAAGGSSARVLSLKSGYGLPTVRALDYDGLYPKAEIRYPDSDLPVQISLRAFSPIIPFDLRNSALPAVAFLYQIKNTTKKPVDVSLALSWENILGVGGTAERGSFHDRTGNRIARIPDIEGYFGLQFTGAPPASPSQDAGMHANATGDYLLLARPERKEAMVTTAGWNALDTHPGWWDSFAKDGSVSGEAPVGREGSAHPAGVVAVRMTIRPGDTVYFPFAIAWNTPIVRDVSGNDYGKYASAVYPTAMSAGRELLGNWRSLLSLTEEWQRALLFSDLPVWLSRRLIDSASILTTHSIYTRDARFALLESVGTGSTADFADARDRPAVGTLLLSFFPSLYAQELTELSKARSPTGGLPRSLGNLETGGLFALPAVAADHPPAGHAELAAPDDPVGASVFVLQFAQYVFWTGDTAFLKYYYPVVKETLEQMLQGCDSTGLPRPISAAGAAPAALTPSDALLWEAALRAGEELTRQPGSADAGNTAGACRQAAARAETEIQKRYWNGRFLAARTVAANKIEVRPGDVSASDQLVGQWAADLLDLGNLLPQDKLNTTLQSLHEPNGGALRPRQSSSRPGDNGPGQEDIGGEKANVLPYAALGAAILSVYQEPGDAGITQIKQLSDVRDNVLRSPWTSPIRLQVSAEAADRRPAGVTHAMDWNALPALTGFSCRVANGALSLTCNLPGTWRTLSAPIFTPRFWGYVFFKPTARGGMLTFRLDRIVPLRAAAPDRRVTGQPSLILKSLRVPGPPRTAGGNAETPSVHVSLRRVPVGARTTAGARGSLILLFETPLEMNAGDRLEVEVH